MIPEKLEDWNYEIIDNLAKKNMNESDRHDFKKNFPNVETLTKICCAFANTKGGFVILGVAQKSSSWIIEGIDDDIELAHQFGKKIKANPTVYFSLPKIIGIPESKKILAVFHIPLSSERPHIPSNRPEIGLFWKRTNKGNEYMSYEEIKMNFQNYEERRIKLKMLYIELLTNIEKSKNMIIDSETQYSLVTLDSDVINNLMVDVYSIINKNNDLVKLLLKIKSLINVFNNKTSIFFNTIIQPLTKKNEIVRSHNDFVSGASENLIRHIKKTLKILEEDFDLKNPFV